MIIYTIVADAIPVEIPYDSWENIPEEAWNQIDQIALDTIREEMRINTWYPLRHYKNEEDAKDQLGL